VTEDREPQSDPDIDGVMRASADDEDKGREYQNSEIDSKEVALLVVTVQAQPDVGYHACMPREHQVATVDVCTSESEESFYCVPVDIRDILISVSAVIVSCRHRCDKYTDGSNQVQVS